MSLECAQQVDRNRQFLKLEFCGRQGIALRGHKDNSTSDDFNQDNFKALVQLRIHAGDSVLESHPASCSKPAAYMSKTSQNELLMCIGEYLTDEIAKDVCASGFFGIQADEVTDVLNWEQLGIVMRYVKGTEIVERLVSFINCESTTGENICQQIVSQLMRMNIDPSKCRAQTYDGAGSMSEKLKGCCAQFLKTVPEAVYYHCASHQLNLVLSKTALISEVQVMLETLLSVGLFFKYSPKWQRELEKCIERVNESAGNSKVTKTKVKTMCQTRWVERHTSLQDFDNMYNCVLDCLSEIATNSEMNWDSKTVTEAQGLVHNIHKSGFIAAFKVNLHMFAYIKPLSMLLQGCAMDVVTAYKEIRMIKEVFNDMKKNPEKEFKPIYRSMEDMAGEDGITMPRVCQRQTSRSNVQALSPEEYWRRTIFVPFLDHLIQAFSDRFMQLKEDAMRGFQLLPKNAPVITPEDAAKICVFQQRSSISQNFHAGNSTVENLLV